MKFFNWKKDGQRENKNQSIKKNNEEKMSFGDKMIRFFVCCGPKDKDKEKKANDKKAKKNA